MTPPMMGVRRERAAGAAAFASSTLRRPRGGWGLAARGIETIVPRVCPEPQPAPSPGQPLHDHHSNLVPNLASRGDTIVTGSRNVEPDPQVMFAPGFALVRL